MQELPSILKEWSGGAGAQGCVLATVVHVEGSAYRRPGARMLIRPDGSRTGTISGGCLEGDVARKAAWWTASGEPVLRVYDTTSDDDAVWAFGLGCNGVIYVLLERVDTPAAGELLAHLEKMQSEKREDVVATVVRGAAHSRFRTGSHFFGSGNLPREFAPAARAVLAARRSRLLHAAGADIFVEYIGPPPRLVVFGAGHDVIPVVAAAATLGWDITVADVRSGYAKPDRFPGAQNVVVLPPDANLRDVRIDSDTAVVLMTHNFPLDTKLLPQLLPLQPRYLGLLGPKKRAERLFEDIDTDPLRYDVHAPIGLDIGGDSPDAIALSIVAEVQAALSGRSGGELRWSRGPIHTPVEEMGQPVEMEDLRTAVAECETIHG